MPLDLYEKHLVFEILGVPDATSVLYIDTAWATGKTQETGAVLVSRDLIEARIDALGTELETRLRELITAWKSVALSGTKLAPNAANQGVDYHPGRQRARIRELVQKIIPVMLQGRDTLHGGSLPLA